MDTRNAGRPPHSGMEDLKRGTTRGSASGSRLFGWQKTPGLVGRSCLISSLVGLDFFFGLFETLVTGLSLVLCISLQI